MPSRSSPGVDEAPPSPAIHSSDRRPLEPNTRRHRMADREASDLGVAPIGSKEQAAAVGRSHRGRSTRGEPSELLGLRPAGAACHSFMLWRSLASPAGCASRPAGVGLRAGDDRVGRGRWGRRLGRRIRGHRRGSWARASGRRRRRAPASELARASGRRGRRGRRRRRGASGASASRRGRGRGDGLRRPACWRRARPTPCSPGWWWPAGTGRAYERGPSGSGRRPWGCRAGRS